MANKIHTYFAAEVEALLPLLHETYRCIHPRMLVEVDGTQGTVRRLR